MSAKDLTGTRFGRLAVIARAPSTSYGATRWHVKCNCGRDRIAFAANLVRGATTSCGCGVPRLTHGQSGGRNGTPSGAYSSWHHMIQRCLNPKNERYPDYGGRGILVCERWLSFDEFFADMGPRPCGMSIERKDTNGSYEPTNCRWATTQEQTRNTRATVVTVDTVQEIIGRFECGESRASIGRRLGISASYVGKIISGNTWREIDRPYLKQERAHG